MHFSSEYSPRAILGVNHPLCRNEIHNYLISLDLTGEIYSEISIAIAKSAHYFYELIIIELPQKSQELLPLHIIRKKNPSALIIVLYHDILPVMKLHMLEQDIDMMIDIASGVETVLMQIKCMMKKYMPTERNMIRYESIIMDRSEQAAIINKRKILLRKREFLLLSYLMNHADTVVSRSQIMKNIWTNRKVKENTIDSQIKRLRDKLGEKASRLIKTVPTKGYCLQESVC